MFLRKLGKFLAFGMGGGLLGVVAAIAAGYVLQNYFGEEMLPLLWLVGGLGGAIVGGSQVSWRKRRRRRRRSRPQVVLPPMKNSAIGVPGADQAAAAENTAVAKDSQSALEGLAKLFQQVTGATIAELTGVRVCDVRLGSDGEPFSVRLSENGQEREVFLVYDHHREVVAEALDAALRREPGNRRAKLFP
jgi:hypothetical protein